MSRTTIAVLALLAASIAATWPSYQVLAHYWNDTNAMGMTHGWLIAAVVLWLLWRERRFDDAGAPDLKWLVPFASSWFLWLVSLRAGLQIVHLVLLPPLAWFAVRGALGSATARRVVYPIGFLYFAIPLWGNLTGVLQWITIYVVRFMLRATGIPAYFRGETVVIPDGYFNIVGGCSGLHYFLVALAVASLYARIHHDPWRRHLKIVVVAGALAMVLNWIRVYAVIVSGHLTDMQSYLVRVDHYWFGWLLFGVAMGLSMWVASRLLPPAPDDPAMPSATGPGPRWATVGMVGAVLVALGLGVAAVQRVQASVVVADVAGPLAAAGITADEQAMESSTWWPRFRGATQEFRGRTTDGNSRVYVAVYPTQRQGAELGYYQNTVTGKRLEAVSEDVVGNTGWTVATDGDDGRWLIATTYTVGGRREADPDRAQVYYALASLAGPVPAAVVSVAAPCAADCGAERASLAAALEQAFAPVSQVLSTGGH